VTTRAPSARRAPSDPQAELLSLQRTFGNRAVGRLLQSHSSPVPHVQAKLRVSQPEDGYEREADALAAEWMRSPSPQAANNDVPPHVMRAADAHTQTASAGTQDIDAPAGANEVEAQVNEARRSGGGAPLPQFVRAFFEPRAGFDLSGVRVHTDARANASAEAIDARAYTIGSDVFFAYGEYAPGTSAGRHLLAHELVHVMQQGRGARGVQRAARRRRKSHARTDDQAATEAAQTTAAEPTVNVYRFTVEGQTITLSEEEYRRELARTIQHLRLNFTLLESEAAYNAAQHQHYLDETYGFAGTVSDMLAQTAPPRVGIWSWPRPAIEAGRQSLDHGRVEVAARQLLLAQQFLRDARREWNAYIQKTTEGAQTAITVLEYTRDISFAIAIGTAAVLAAPVVAAGAGAAATGLGLTGATATTATALGTGVVITGSGAAVGGTLRGVSSAGGQALAGGPVSLSQVKRDVAEGAKRGAVDAGSAVVGFGAGRALGLGAQGTSLGGRVVKGSLAGSAGGATGGALEATLEGKSAGEVLQSGAKGAAAGAVGGAFGGAASGIGQQAPVKKFVAETLSEAAGGAGGAALAGGTPEEIKAALIASVIAGRATGAAATQPPSTGSRKSGGRGKTPPSEPTPPATEEKQPIGMGETKFHLAPSREGETIHVTGIRRGEGIPRGGMGDVIGDAIINKVTPAHAGKVRQIHYPKVTNKRMLELFEGMKTPEEMRRAFKESERSAFGKMSEKIAAKLGKQVDWDNVEIMPLTKYTYSITVPLISG
jgi:hypothetical protein